MALITHAHSDRIGGIDTLLSEKIDVKKHKFNFRKKQKKMDSKNQKAKLDNDPIIKINNIS